MSLNEVVKEPSDAPSLSEYVAFNPNAYRNRALALISHCRYCSAVSEPRSALQDNELRKVLEVCNNAVHSAAHAGENVTNEANKCFKLAVQVSDRYEKMFVRRRHKSIIEIMRQAEWNDVRFLQNTRLRMGETTGESPVSRIPVNFVIFRTLPDLVPTIIRQMLVSRSDVSEALWNFSCFEDNRRITLQQNAHFYLNLPISSDEYEDTLLQDPLWTFDGVRRDETIYVFVDGPSRLFLDTEERTDVFGGIFMPNDVMIFKDARGTLQGEMRIKTDIRRTPNVWHYEQRLTFPAQCAPGNHRALQPIITAPWNSPGAGSSSENWRDLIRSTWGSGNINVHFYAHRLPPLPPTSGRPGYSVLYRPLHNALNNDVLLEIFNFCRLDDEENWNLQLIWCKLSHVCRRWRNLIYDSSSSYLKVHLPLTNGAPIADMLSSLPHLPLIIDHKNSAAMTAEEERGILLALEQYNRIRRVVLRAPYPSLHKLLVTMDKCFVGLEHLSLLSTTEENTRLMLPNTFLAPNLRHLTLFGFGLPTGIPLVPLLVSTVALVTLTLTHIRASGYSPPEHLVTYLQSLPQLEELSIGFFTPLPRPHAERELLRVPIVQVTLPALKRVIFRGVGAYLESLISRIRSPLLERLSITLFNQISYTLPRLSNFTVSTEGLRHPVGKVIFGKGAVSIVTGHWDEPGDGNFSLHISCKDFDWQIDSSARVCEALMPVLSIVEELTLGFDEHRMPSAWQGPVDDMVWHRLLLPFRGVRKLRVDGTLALELSSALQPDEAGLVPELLPELQEIEAQLEDEHAKNAFTRFVEARQPGRLPTSLIPQAPPTEASQLNEDESLPTESSERIIPTNPRWVTFGVTPGRCTTELVSESCG